jgi:hypothetical protein
VLNFLTTSRGKVWDKNYLGWWFGERCRAIGLDRSAHGLRKASARRFAERGATVPQLMAIFGWKTPSIALHYVEMANRKKMALDAQGAMDWDEIEKQDFPHPRFRWGKPRLKAKENNGFAFPPESFSESGLFNELRPDSNKEIPLSQPWSHMSLAAIGLAFPVGRIYPATYIL